MSKCYLSMAGVKVKSEYYCSGVDSADSRVPCKVKDGYMLRHILSKYENFGFAKTIVYESRAKALAGINYSISFDCCVTVTRPNSIRLEGSMNKLTKSCSNCEKSHLHSGKLYRAQAF